MKLTRLFLFVLLIFLLNSCSFGFFMSKNQEVTINKDSLNTIQINKKTPEMKNNKYILPRNGMPQQLEIKRDGYKKEYKVLVPYKLSAEGFATIAVNAAVAGTATALSVTEIGTLGVVCLSTVSSMIGGVWGSMFLAIDPKLWNYDSSINIKDKLIKIPLRDSLTKEIKFNKVSFDVSPENSEDYNVTYSDYKKGKFKTKVNTKTENGIKIDASYFADELNKILQNNRFIDTTGLVLKSNFNQNAYLNATIFAYKFFWVANTLNNTADRTKTGFINLEVKVKWDLLDYYKKSIYSDTIKSKSGEFISFIEAANSSYEKDAIKDALEAGLYSFMNTDKFQNIMKLPKVSRTDTLKQLEIKTSKSFVSSIELAVEASVTIKTKEGHGSGFLISEDGYIITNYHVISDSAKLEVIMHDGTKVPARIIRFNKEADLALLKIDKNNLVPFLIPQEKSSLIGREIYVIGTPSAQDLSQTLTKGIISSIRKQANGSTLIQTDASMSPGNSGGPVIDKDGKLVGVVNAKIVGTGVEGISFAIHAADITKNLSLKLK